MSLLFQALKQVINDFENNELNEFKRQAQNMIKTCDEASQLELGEIVLGTHKSLRFRWTNSWASHPIISILKGLDKELTDSNAAWIATATKLEQSTNERKVLEGIIDLCQQWFKEAEINLANDVRNTTSAEILVEHIGMGNL